MVILYRYIKFVNSPVDHSKENEHRVVSELYSHIFLTGKRLSILKYTTKQTKKIWITILRKSISEIVNRCNYLLSHLFFHFEKPHQFGEVLIYVLVGNEGFEPPMPDSESGALPLGEFPTCE